MSTVAATELQQFAHFIQAKLKSGEHQLSPEEALDEWRHAHPTEQEMEENVQAVQVALDQMNAGEKGISGAESVRRLRERAGIQNQ